MKLVTFGDGAGRVGHVDGEEIAVLDVPTMREWFERGGADETGERLLQLGEGTEITKESVQIIQAVIGLWIQRQDVFGEFLPERLNRCAAFFKAVIALP